MTNMQNSYWAEQTKKYEAATKRQEARETERSNKAQEAETQRSNLVKEGETLRHNKVEEERKDLERIETERHQRRQDRSATAKNIIEGVNVGTKVVKTVSDLVGKAKEAATKAAQLAFFS